MPSSALQGISPDFPFRKILQFEHHRHFNILDLNQTPFSPEFKDAAFRPRQALLRYDVLSAESRLWKAAADRFSLIIVAILLVNAVAILSEDRFLARSMPSSPTL